MHQSLALVAMGRLPRRLYTVKIIVVKLAQPPSTLEMGSARNTPHTPRPRRGRIYVRGMTITALRRRAKDRRYPFAFERRARR